MSRKIGPPIRPIHLPIRIGPANACDPYVLQFHPQMKTAILEGRKSSTTRSMRIGHAGDVFTVEGIPGVYFRIISVGRRQLRSVADFAFREEGFTSPEEFVEFWMFTHRGSFARDKEYFFYQFSPVLNSCTFPILGEAGEAHGD